MLKNKAILLCFVALVLNQLTRAPYQWFHAWENATLSLKGLHERTIQSEKQSVRTIEGGQGPVLILLHEEGGDALSWLKMYSALLEHFHIVSVELAGHGETELFEPMSYRALYRSFSLVREKYSEPVVIVASGFSARVVVDYISRAEDSQDRLALVSPLGILNDPVDMAVVFPTQPAAMQKKLDYIGADTAGELPGFVVRDLMERQETKHVLWLKEAAAGLHSVEAEFFYLSNKIDLIWGGG